MKVFEALLFSPVCGFVLAALLLLALKFAVKRKDLYEAPQGQTPPPLWIRGLLILTCTLVSFFHGGNDGQKGMGLIMLILIGAAPTAYALNRTMADATTPAFVAGSTARARSSPATRRPLRCGRRDARADRRKALETKKLNTPEVYARSRSCPRHRDQVKDYGSIRRCRQRRPRTCATTCTSPPRRCADRRSRAGLPDAEKGHAEGLPGRSTTARASSRHG